MTDIIPIETPTITAVGCANMKVEVSHTITLPARNAIPARLKFKFKFKLTLRLSLTMMCGPRQSPGWVKLQESDPHSWNPRIFLNMLADPDDRARIRVSGPRHLHCTLEHWCLWAGGEGGDIACWLDPDEAMAIPP
jgi:hypothetical protein